MGILRLQDWPYKAPYLTHNRRKRKWRLKSLNITTCNMMILAACLVLGLWTEVTMGGTIPTTDTVDTSTGSYTTDGFTTDVLTTITPMCPTDPECDSSCYNCTCNSTTGIIECLCSESTVPAANNTCEDPPSAPGACSPGGEYFAVCVAVPLSVIVAAGGAAIVAYFVLRYRNRQQAARSHQRRRPSVAAPLPHPDTMDQLPSPTENVLNLPTQPSESHEADHSNNNTNRPLPGPPGSLNPPEAVQMRKLSSATSLPRSEIISILPPGLDQLGEDMAEYANNTPTGRSGPLPQPPRNVPLPPIPIPTQLSDTALNKKVGLPERTPSQTSLKDYINVPKVLEKRQGQERVLPPVPMPPGMRAGGGPSAGLPPLPFPDVSANSGGRRPSNINRGDLPPPPPMELNKPPKRCANTTPSTSKVDLQTLVDPPPAPTGHITNPLGHGYVNVPGSIKTKPEYVNINDDGRPIGDSPGHTNYGYQH